MSTEAGYRESAKSHVAYETEIGELRAKISALMKDRERPRRWHWAVLSFLFASCCALAIGFVVSVSAPSAMAVAVTVMLAFWCACGLIFLMAMVFTTGVGSTSWLDPWPQSRREGEVGIP